MMVMMMGRMMPMALRIFDFDSERIRRQAQRGISVHARRSPSGHRIVTVILRRELVIRDGIGRRGTRILSRCIRSRCIGWLRTLCLLANVDSDSYTGNDDKEPDARRESRNLLMDEVLHRLPHSVGIDLRTERNR